MTTEGESMAFVTDTRPFAPGYVDLDRCILLGPDAALMPPRGHSGDEPSFPTPHPEPNGWVLELYGEEDETVRVLIAGEED